MAFLPICLHLGRKSCRVGLTLLSQLVVCQTSLTTCLQTPSRIAVSSWTWKGVRKKHHPAFISFLSLFPCTVLEIINQEISCSETVQQWGACTVLSCINPFTWKLNFNWKIGFWRNPQPVSAQLQQCNSYSGKLLMLVAVHVICGIYFRFNISIRDRDYVLMLQAGVFMHLTSILCIIHLAVPGCGSNRMTLLFILN